MTYEEASAFVKSGFEALYRELDELDSISLKMPDVPEEMRAGPEDADGWCRWKLIPSPVTAEDLDRQEQETGCRFPVLLRAFFSAYCHYFMDCGLGTQKPDKPFSDLDNAWNPVLVRGGYLPFLWDEDLGCFIRCIDLANMPDEDRCPVVQIDHEILFDLGERADREALAPHMEPVAESLRAFLEERFSGWTAFRGKKLARRYVEGLREAYEDAGGKEVWAEFAGSAHGVSEAHLTALKALYPELPASLEALLRIYDGTYYQEYRPGQTTCLYFLGSDMEEYPYYLLSAAQMVKTDRDFKEWGDYLIDREYDDIPVPEGVTHDLESLRWLHFSDCMNNGGTSQLFIDFSPSEKGKTGQVVRFTHDPDELVVVADSFSEYLELLMDNEYDFINEDTVEE